MRDDVFKCACCGRDLVDELLGGCDGGEESGRADGHLHDTVNVTVGAMSADIDVAIAPLVRALWECGIATTTSCQEDGWGKVWIEFADSEDVVRFLNAAGKFESDVRGLYNRMAQCWVTENRDDCWDFEVLPWDFAHHVGEDGEESHDGVCDFDLRYSVRFPPKDLAEVTERLKAKAREVARKRMTDPAATPAGSPTAFPAEPSVACPRVPLPGRTRHHKTQSHRPPN